MIISNEEKELFNAVEALLFVSGDPVSILKISEILGLETDYVNSMMNKMMQYYNSAERGIKLIRLDSSYQLTTCQQYFDYVVKLVAGRHKQALSASNLEVLSIISYNQPITKAAIEQVRGVDSSYSIMKLIERDLITQKGRLDAPGKPILYVTTDEFLRCFGLESLDEMPDLNAEQFENIGFIPDDAAKNVTFEEMVDRNTTADKPFGDDKD